MNAAAKALSLFSGAGGLDIAAHNAGFRTVACIEFEESFARTLRVNQVLANSDETGIEAVLRDELPRMGKLNHVDVDLLRRRLAGAPSGSSPLVGARVLHSDIRDVAADGLMRDLSLKRGELGLLVGGPPCQSFSKAGQRGSLDDDRGLLFLEYARFVREMRPRFFLFENVKNITASPAEVTSVDCRRCGTQVLPLSSPRGSDAATSPCPRCQQEGQPTHSSRTSRGALELIVAEFCSLGYTLHSRVLNAVDFGVPQFRERFFIVGSRDNEHYSYPDPTHASMPTEGQADLFGYARKEHETVWGTLFAGGDSPHHGPDVSLETSVLWVKNVVRPHDEPVTWRLDRPSPTVGAHQAAKLAIAPYGVPEEQLARQQWHTLGRRQGDSPPVPVPHTYLSDEDLLRLQTFPASWFVAGTRMQRAFQIGNAVPPALGEAVLRALPHDVS